MVRDPHSREFDKKPLKSFLVNQTVLMLERGQIRIPNREDDETLARQMTNYQVVRYSAKTGEATYTDVDEHALDGLMFGLLAFINEKPELASTIIQKHSATKISRIKKSSKDPFKQTKESNDSNESELRIKKKRPKYRQNLNKGFTWGSRGSSTSTRMPSRGSW